MSDEEKMFRVETICWECGATYLSTAMHDSTPPVRCKECKSSRTGLNPAKEQQVWTVYL